MTVKIKCPGCGTEIDINPASLLGSIVTEKKIASNKLNSQKPRKRKKEGTP